MTADIGRALALASIPIAYAYDVLTYAQLLGEVKTVAAALPAMAKRTRPPSTRELDPMRRRASDGPSDA